MNIAKIIDLTRGFKALVSADDFERVSMFKWCASESRAHLVAMRSFRVDGCTRSVLMHRFIMTAPASMSVDHINGDSLDNRRENLRLVTHAQNRLNTKKQANNTSGFKGVIRDKRSGKWIARIAAQRKTHHLGLHDSPEVAARAYDEAAKKLHGDFARLNFGS